MSFFLPGNYAKVLDNLGEDLKCAIQQFQVSIQIILFVTYLIAYK